MKRSDLRLPVFQKRKPWGYRTVENDELRSMAPELLPILEPVLTEQGWMRVGDFPDGSVRDPLNDMWCPNHLSPWYANEGACEYRHLIYYHHPEKDWRVDPCGVMLPFEKVARRAGYVRLDGVDVEALRDGIELHRKDYHSDPELIRKYLALARAVLAVLLDGKASVVTKDDWEWFLRMASNGETFDLEAVFEGRLAALEGETS